MSMDYLDTLRPLAPEGALVLTALVVIGVDLAGGRRRPAGTRLAASVAIGSAGLVAAFALAWQAGAPGTVAAGALTLDGLALSARLGVLALAAATLLLLPGGRRPAAPAEFVALILFAVAGMTLMAAAANLLVAFVALELSSLSLYALVGLERRRPEATEAALKYFLVGGVSAAFLLFGFSLLYGASGTIDLRGISRELTLGGMTPLLAVGLTMITVGFGFKVAAAPFHLWAPDVYQGAPPLVAALVASASKLAGVVLFYRLFWSGLRFLGGEFAWDGGAPGWVPLLALVALVSLILGNVAALIQSSVRRLLAYSAIAHAGLLVLALLIGDTEGPGPLLYYAITYGAATVGAFGVLAAMDRIGPADALTDLAGLRQRAPLLAVLLAIFVLSLAGIPPLAGFLAKFQVFAAALRGGPAMDGLFWLGVAAIVLSAVSLYYYLLILKQAFVARAPHGAPVVIVPPAVSAALLLLAAVVVVAGVWPAPLLQWLE
jgi:NADH-quinone oxidoreductase subunit N